VRFRPDSDEETCSKVVYVGLLHNDDLNPFICLRRAGHDGECIALACDAAKADGVCSKCREPAGEPHRNDCLAKQYPS